MKIVSERSTSDQTDKHPGSSSRFIMDIGTGGELRYVGN